jgi:hypothetical protein
MTSSVDTLDPAKEQETYGYVYDPKTQYLTLPILKPTNDKDKLPELVKNVDDFAYTKSEYYRDDVVTWLNEKPNEHSSFCLLIHFYEKARREFNAKMEEVQCSPYYMLEEIQWVVFIAKRILRCAVNLMTEGSAFDEFIGEVSPFYKTINNR